MVARSVRDAEVVGSSPVASTRYTERSTCTAGASFLREKGICDEVRGGFLIIPPVLVHDVWRLCGIGGGKFVAFGGDGG